MLKKTLAFNPNNRLKSVINFHISPNILFQEGGIEKIMNMGKSELEDLAIKYSVPKELFSENWWFMKDATRSNQQVAYPGFNKIT